MVHHDLSIHFRDRDMYYAGVLVRALEGWLKEGEISGSGRPVQPYNGSLPTSVPINNRLHVRQHNPVQFSAPSWRPRHFSSIFRHKFDLVVCHEWPCLRHNGLDEGAGRDHDNLLLLCTRPVLRDDEIPDAVETEKARSPANVPNNGRKSQWHVHEGQHVDQVGQRWPGLSWQWPANGRWSHSCGRRG